MQIRQAELKGNESQVLTDLYNQIQKAYDCLRANKYAEALEISTAILPYATNQSLQSYIHCDILVVYAKTQEENKQLEAAIKTQKIIQDIDPYKWDSYLCVATMARKLDEREQERTILMDVLDKISEAPLENQPSRFFMAKLYSALCCNYQVFKIDLTQAKEYGEMAIASDKTYRGGYSALAHACRELGLHDEAENYFKIAYEAEPELLAKKHPHKEPDLNHVGVIPGLPLHEVGKIGISNIPRKPKKRSIAPVRQEQETKKPAVGKQKVAKKPQTLPKYQQNSQVSISNAFAGLKINFPQKHKAELAYETQTREKVPVSSPPKITPQTKPTSTKKSEDFCSRLQKRFFSGISTCSDYSKAISESVSTATTETFNTCQRKVEQGITYLYQGIQKQAQNYLPYFFANKRAQHVAYIKKTQNRVVKNN